MTDMNTGIAKTLPEFGETHEPIYSSDNPTVVVEKVRAFLTTTIAQHEERHAGGTEASSPDYIPCMSLSVPCYLSGDTEKDYADALVQPAHILSALNDEAARLGYVPLGVTPGVFSTPEKETYQNAIDRATGWKVELTAKANIKRFFDDPETDKLTLTRLWLELSIKSHGPAYAHAVKELSAGQEAQAQLQRIMAGNFRA